MRRGQSPMKSGDDEQDWGDTFAVLASVYGFTPGDLEGFSFGQVKAYANRAHLMEKRRGDAHEQSLVPLVNALFPK